MFEFEEFRKKARRAHLARNGNAVLDVLEIDIPSLPAALAEQ
ncbi:MAG: hypothetical protein U1F35_00540 [Steroidobacteraceae bacterium]